MTIFISSKNGRQFQKSAHLQPSFPGLNTPEHPSYQLESKSSDRSDRRRFASGKDESSRVLV